MVQADKFAEIKSFLEEQITHLDRVGGITKLEGLTEKEVKDIEIIIFDYPELEHFVLENDGKYDVFFRIKELNSKIEIGKTFNNAKNDYINKNYKKCNLKLSLILRMAAHPKSEVYELAGLTCYKLEKFDVANDYLRLAKYLSGERFYNNININEVRERVEGKMKQVKKNNYSQLNYELDRHIHIERLTLPALDEIIDYIQSNHLDIETAGKKLNLTNEQIDFVKLIYAREFYKQGDIDKGNAYLKSVEETRGKTSEVTRLCLETRTNKKFFQYRDNNVPKKLSLVKPGKRK